MAGPSEYQVGLLTVIGTVGILVLVIAIISKLVGLFYFMGLVTCGCLGIFDLRGMEVNLPQNIYAIASFTILIVVYYYASNRRYRNCVPDL